MLVINILVTFFLIKATDIILHKKCSNKRLMLGMIIGSLSSLIILMPTLPYILNALIKFSLAIIIVFIIYGYKNIYTFIKNSLIFIIINFIFAGIILFVWSFIAPVGMVYNNGFVYFDISFTLIVVSACIAYFIIKLFRYIIDTKFSTDKVYNIKIIKNNNVVSIKGFPDSGNTLVDFYTGLPVIICSETSCGEIMPDEYKNFDYTSSDCLNNINGIRILPYSTVGYHGILPVFKPSLVEINGKAINALIGITKDKFHSEVDAIFNPKLLI